MERETPHTPETLAPRVLEGRKVEEILKSEEFRAAIAKLRAAVYQEWITAETLEEREKAHGVTVGIERILDSLAVVVQDGEIAQEATRLMHEKDLRRED